MTARKTPEVPGGQTKMTRNQRDKLERYILHVATLVLLLLILFVIMGIAVEIVFRLASFTMV